MGKNRKKVHTKSRRKSKLDEKKYDCKICKDTGELHVPIYETYLTVRCPCLKFDVEVELEVEDQSRGSGDKKKLGKTLKLGFFSVLGN